MGTYYPTTSAQIDVLSAPYNQDQKFTSFSEPNVLHGNMMMYMNPNTSTGNFSEISSLNPNNGEQFSSMSGRNEMMFIPPTSDHTSMQAISCPLNAGTVKNVDKFIPGLNSRDQLGMMEGEQTFQSLSLSLSTQMSTPAFEYQYTNPGMNLRSESSVRQMSFKIDESFSHGDGNNTIRFGLPNSSPQFSMSAKDVNFGQYQSGVASVLLKSKYLKAAQQLLDEIVNVREAVKRHELGKDQVSGKVEDGSKESRGESQPPADANESDIGSSSAHELSSAEKQDLQNKLDKLLSMLDEVDRKYKQYGHQMQILVSSFDIVAGNGAAKPYTALALKTISRHFRCLRDAITDQIQATRKSLGEPDNGMGAPIPRLRYVDQQLRQQRALQQFGMMRHAWRPQRGLPETAVTILRAWLFEHFLHPYPKDSEKIMLARQAGLTRGQVANWFINARVRLWKPMVEEMYKEEFGEAEINCSEDNTTHEMQESSTSMAHDSKANVTHNTEMKGHSSSNSGQHVNTLVNNDLNHGFYTTDLLVTSGAYQMSELGNFSVDNQVSLDLGLQHPADADVVTRFQVNPTTSNYQYTGQGNQQDNSFGNQHIDFVT